MSIPIDPDHLFTPTGQLMPVLWPRVIPCLRLCFPAGPAGLLAYLLLKGGTGMVQRKQDAPV